MPLNVPQFVSDMITLNNTLRSLDAQINDVEKRYTQDVQAVITALATNATPVPGVPQFTKADVQLFFAMLPQLQNFFGNVAVVTADYRGTVAHTYNIQSVP